LRSSDWYVYKAIGDVLVRDRSEVPANRVFAASQDALFFGIHFFDSVSEDERSRLRLDYTIVSARTIPESFEERPLALDLGKSDDGDLSRYATNPDVLVVAGLVTGQRSFRLAMSSTLTLAEQRQSDERVALRGHVLSVPPGAIPLERKERFQEPPIRLTIVMRHADELGFNAFAAAVNDPATPIFGKFQSQAELTKNFGPSESAYSDVVSYLKKFDFQFSEFPSNRMTINLKGHREMIEHAFQVGLQDYRLRDTTFFAATNNPSVPASISPHIFAIVGLSTLSQPHPGISEVDSPAALSPIAFSKAYDFPSGGDGAGQTIGLLEYDNFKPEDLKIWLSTMKTLPEAALSRVQVKSVFDGTGIVTKTGEGEVLLDLEVVIGMAPQAQYKVYAADKLVSLHAVLNAMVDDKVSVISNSWSQCESMKVPADLDSLELLLGRAKASGISVFTASGDDGAVCRFNGKTDVSVPADAPSAMGVGGTSLDMGTDNSYVRESWYPKGGFGLSSHFNAPPYFARSATSSSKRRSVPDFAAHADEQKGIAVYQSDRGDDNAWYTAAGTSISAPIWAAATAILNQRTGHPAGLIVSWLAISDCAKHLHVPKDMTGANNDFGHLGLGSIDLTKLIGVEGTCHVKRP
jgi:subtilase family serine protease